MHNRYRLEELDGVETPALVYYKEVIVENIKKAIAVAGGPGRLWPHVKSHKSPDMVRIQMELGIRRFKCATIAEAEMVADCGAEHVLLAYPLVGPNIPRFLALQRSRPGTAFWAIGDNLGQLEQLAGAAEAAGEAVRLLIDVNMGMNRTGVPVRLLAALCRGAAGLEGISLEGLHCYDGHHNTPAPGEREKQVADRVAEIRQVVEELQAEGLALPVMVMGGTPSFPFHAKGEGYLSPGTLFINDYGYATSFRDLDFPPGALLLTRVVSHPEEGLFTLDLGTKAIATDPAVRGVIVGMDNAAPLFQSEEHWVFAMKEGEADNRPAIGTVLYVMPTHICPTSALYDRLLVAEGGRITGSWPVVARSRRLTI